MLKNILMLTKEEPNKDSKYSYYYEKSIPAIAEAYSNVFLASKESFTAEDTLVVAEKLAVACAYREKGFAVLYQTEEFGTATATEELPFVTDYPCDLSDEEIYKIFARQKGLPLTIAQTSRLILREITLADLPELYDIYDDDACRQFLEKLYPWDEETQYQKEYIRNQYGLYGYGLWAVILRETGKMIGRVGISQRVIDGEECKEIGYVIHRDYRLRGYAREACEAAMRFADHVGMDSLYIVTEPQNRASCELARSLGFIPVAKDENEGFLIYRHQR